MRNRKKLAKIYQLIARSGQAGQPCTAFTASRWTSAKYVRYTYSRHTDVKPGVRCRRGVSEYKKYLTIHFQCHAIFSILNFAHKNFFSSFLDTHRFWFSERKDNVRIFISDEIIGKRAKNDLSCCCARVCARARESEEEIVGQNAFQKKRFSQKTFIKYR